MKNENNDNITVLAIGAHPDDYEIGAAMRLLWHTANGDNVVGIVCSDGERCGDRDIRVKETNSAAKAIDLKELYMLQFPDTRFPDIITIKDIFEEIIEKEKPSVVYTHTKGDRHQDHRAVAKASEIACRNIPNILTYKSPSTFLSEFNPHIFYLGSENDYTKKEKVLEIYESQINGGNIFNMERLRVEARFYAANVQSYKKISEERPYAEPFCANHIILNDM